MPRHNKTPVEARACCCVELCITCDCNPTESPRINQVLRLPSACRYFIIRHRDTLKPHAESGNGDATVMMALCDALLDSDDLLGGTL
jgi:hypothetical protein